MHGDGIWQSEELRITESYLDTMAEALASPTSVDGAVVVTYELKIVGFGAKFKVPPSIHLSTANPRIPDSAHSTRVTGA